MVRPSLYPLALALVLALAGSTLVAASTCTEQCWTDYNTEVQDCIDKANPDGLLKPVKMAPMLGLTDTQYTGERVDIADLLKKQCEANVGKDKLRACLKGCVAPPPKPVSCADRCRARYEANTLGRFRCLYNCP